MAQLRLKRLFLLFLVTSLTACALVAIAALLLSRFTDTTGRILGTLGALGFHSAMAMMCAASLERRRRPVLSTIGLIGFVACFALMMLCLWWPALFRAFYNSYETCVLRTIGTTLVFSAVYMLLIPCVTLARARRWVPLPQISTVLCTIAFLMVLVCLWAERADNETFGKITAVAAAMAFSCAHQCLLGRVSTARNLGWLIILATGGVWTVAAMLSSMILFVESVDDMLIRLLGAAGVFDVVASIALVIMAKVRNVEKTESLESTPARLTLQCPRCSTQQTLDAGPSKCAACGLKFRIDIEEPRCAKCGYLLWQLPERRCPECGTTF